MTESNIPRIQFENLFECDPFAQQLFCAWMGKDVWGRVEPMARDLGRMAAMATPLSASADRHQPVLSTHDERGDRIDRVQFHPDYHELERIAYGSGLVGLKYQREFLGAYRHCRHLSGYCLGYVFAQTEVGLYCPVCMTDGVGRVLERHASSLPVAAKTISHLASTDLDSLWQGAMFLTERQGGSDVGSNDVCARQEGDKWILSGDKWFCSNVTADAILALARMPEGQPGTRGLGLFLLLRKVPDDNWRTIRIHRLKDKMGVRSMPTGEVTLEGSVATLIGGEGQGFKQMTEMLNLSRLYNAVASIAIERRAIVEALAYGQQRQAFGRSLGALPLWRAGMADLIAEHMGMFVLVFEAVRSLDASDCGDDVARRLSRVLIPMAKALSGKLAIFTVSECMEAIGGNAYIEESIMPRLLRDAQVLPIWEGTTNILTLDALRAIEKEASHQVLMNRIRQAIEDSAGMPDVPAEWFSRLRERLQRLNRLLVTMASLDSDRRQQAARLWIEETGRTLQLALLLEAADRPACRGMALAALRRLMARPHSVGPLAVNEAVELVPTEEALILAGYPVRSV